MNTAAHGRPFSIGSFLEGWFGNTENMFGFGVTGGRDHDLPSEMGRGHLDVCLSSRIALGIAQPFCLAWRVGYSKCGRRFSASTRVSSSCFSAKTYYLISPCFCSVSCLLSKL